MSTPQDAGAGFWSTLLYFHICREPEGDVLRVFLGEQVCAWSLRGDFPTGAGERRVGVEPGLLRREEVSGCAGTLWDDGFCHAGAPGREAERSFLWAYEGGRITLSLSGVRVHGTYELSRQSPELWEIWPSARAERVA